MALKLTAVIVEVMKNGLFLLQGRRQDLRLRGRGHGRRRHLRQLALALPRRHQGR